VSVTNDPNIHVDFCSHATLISEHKLWAATFGTDPPDEGTPAARWRPIKFPAGARQAVEDLQRKASGLPTNQERKDAELALEAVIAQLPVETDVWNHLPAFKHFAGRLFDIAAETQLRNGAPDRGLLDGLVAEVVDAVLSKDAKPDEWWRFARKGSRFPFERVILREELRQYLTKNRFSYWFRRYSLVVEATTAEHAVETTAPADPDSRMALDDSGASESPTPDADVPDKGRV
jgi:hypothetical protein